MGIPKIIHQMWLDKRDNIVLCPYPKYVRYGRTFQELNPDFEYVYWTRERFETILISHPVLSRYEGLYRRMGKMVEKSDFARCCILYVYGGLYFDMDYICAKSLASFVETHDWLMFYEPNEHMEGVLCSSCLGSKPGSHFWIRVLDRMNRDYVYQEKAFSTNEFTGPRLLYLIFKESSDLITERDLSDYCMFCPMIFYNGLPVKTGSMSKRCKSYTNIYTYTLWTEGTGWGNYAFYMFVLRCGLLGLGSYLLISLLIR
jgi:mannosyltransferase OCH1-like enzyme